MILVMITASVLPSVLLLLYIWKKDPVPEPFWWLFRSFTCGVLICSFVAAIENIVKTMLFGSGEPTTLLGTTLMAFLVAALPEEGCKLITLHGLLKKNPYFDEHIDGIVYAVCVGLGFATVENIAYVLGEPDNWMGVAISRALLAVPAHYAFAVVMGYYYSVYHFVDRSKAVRMRILLIPVLLHGIYDALAFSGTVNPVIGGMAFFVLVFFCIKMHKYCDRQILAQIKRDMDGVPLTAWREKAGSTTEGEHSSFL